MLRNPLQKLAIYSCCAAIGVSATTCFLPEQSKAQSGSGIIIFGNTKDNALSYYLDSGRSNITDRYYLELKPQKFQISEILVNYPEYYDGTFDPSAIDVRVNNRNVELKSAKWDKDTRLIEVVLKEPLPPSKTATLVLSYVRNPRTGGLFQFDARVRGSNDLPILRYVGSWVIGID